MATNSKTICALAINNSASIRTFRRSIAYHKNKILLYYLLHCYRSYGAIHNITLTGFGGFPPPPFDDKFIT